MGVSAGGEHRACCDGSVKSAGRESRACRDRRDIISHDQDALEYPRMM